VGGDLVGIEARVVGGGRRHNDAVEGCLRREGLGKFHG
jgi:hypothetical protein